MAPVFKSMNWPRLFPNPPSCFFNKSRAAVSLTRPERDTWDHTQCLKKCWKKTPKQQLMHDFPSSMNDQWIYQWYLWYIDEIQLMLQRLIGFRSFSFHIVLHDLLQDLEELGFRHIGCLSSEVKRGRKKQNEVSRFSHEGLGVWNTLLSLEFLVGGSWCYLMTAAIDTKFHIPCFSQDTTAYFAYELLCFSWLSVKFLQLKHRHLKKTCASFP